MSRIGMKPVEIKSGVEVKLDGQVITVKGGKSTLAQILPAEAKVNIEGSTITVEPVDDSTRAKAMWGLSRALIQNMVTGVSEGFTKKLEINGVGYRAAVKGKTLELALGFSHPVIFDIPEGIEIKAPKPTELEISGADKQLVGQVAAKIRSYRKPEPYKGKGVRYEGEYVRSKEGKKK